MKKRVKVFAVGNSFSENATEFLPRIVEESGHELILGKASVGGCSLERHCSMAEIHERDPSDPAGRPYNMNGEPASLKEMLSSDDWRFVTIQQASLLSLDAETYRPHARNLRDYIKEHAPRSEVIFHQTWEYRVDSDRLYREGYGPVEMYQALTRAYLAIAEELGIGRIIPTGNAFRLADEAPEGRFRRDPHFDYDNPSYPGLPVETNSLHKGYFWNEIPAENGGGTIRNFLIDSRHANPAGKYLGACVWFEFFFGEDVRKIRFRPEELTDERARYLRRVAHATVNGVLPAAWPADLGKPGVRWEGDCRPPFPTRLLL